MKVISHIHFLKRACVLNHTRVLSVVTPSRSQRGIEVIFKENKKGDPDVGRLWQQIDLTLLGLGSIFAQNIVFYGYCTIQCIGDDYTSATTMDAS